MKRIETDARTAALYVLSAAYLVAVAVHFKRQQERDELLNEIAFRTSQTARQTSPDHDG